MHHVGDLAHRGDVHQQLFDHRVDDLGHCIATVGAAVGGGGQGLLLDAVIELEDNYDALREDFRAFIPDLRAAVAVRIAASVCG